MLSRILSMALVIGTPTGQDATHRLQVVQLTTSAGGLAERSMSSDLKALKKDGQTISHMPHLTHRSVIGRHLHGSRSSGPRRARSRRWRPPVRARDQSHE